MDNKETIEYFSHSIKNNVKFKNKVLEFKLEKYKEIINILLICDRYENELLNEEITETLRKKNIIILD